MRNTFAIDIYETGDIFQTVFGYVVFEDSETADIEIKMPLYIKPSAIRSDVQEHLREYDPNLMLGNLKFELAPQNQIIYP